MNGRHETYMRTALAEAAKGRGHVEPNPQVGTVIVKDQKVVATGHHGKFGGPHAELEAIQAAGAAAAGATLYVNLEPCAHQGKTAPCADAVIEAGIAEVVSAMTDPNPLTSGKGHEKLRAAGISLREGVLEEEARRINAPYVKFITDGIPYVTAKWAMTLDGRIAAAKGDSKWISCERSRDRVHEIRGFMDAVLVGIGTVLADDPLLTARGHGPRTPSRIVADSRARTPLDCTLLRTLDDGKVIIATAADAPEDRLQRLRDKGADVIVTSMPAKVNFKELFKRLGGIQMTNILVEGGGIILGALFEEALVDAVKAFICPKIIGDADAPATAAGSGADLMSKALSLKEMSVERVGEDLLVEGLTNDHH